MMLMADVNISVSQLVWTEFVNVNMALQKSQMVDRVLLVSTILLCERI